MVYSRSIITLVEHNDARYFYLRVLYMRLSRLITV